MSMHRNNAAEWIMLIAIAPAVLIARAWLRIRRRFGKSESSS
jgi:hypothetical protein